MTKRRIFFYSIIAVMFAAIGSYAGTGPEETAAQVVTAVQSGNGVEVARYFNAMVDLTLPGYDDSYSKAQAGQILKEFFTQQPVKSLKVTRQGNSPDGSQYTIGTLETSKKSYRIYFLIKATGGQYLVQQFQIQDL
jgi:hypothetical protein